MLRYENVSFVKDYARRQTKEEFIASHINIYWQNRKESTRRKMLSEVYDLINGTEKNKK